MDISLSIFGILPPATLPATQWSTVLSLESLCMFSVMLALLIGASHFLQLNSTYIGGETLGVTSLPQKKEANMDISETEKNYTEKRVRVFRQRPTVNPLICKANPAGLLLFTFLYNNCLYSLGIVDKLIHMYNYKSGYLTFPSQTFIISLYCNLWLLFW